MKYSNALGFCFAVLLFATGCSDRTFVPVSGVVNVDGKPYGKAVVTFQPIGTPESPNPGRGSSAYTDESGRFKLFSDDKDGAAVGKHLVRIMTRGNDVVGASPEGGSSDETTIKPNVDPIPASWNSQSKVEFDVPPGGTNKADFDIATKSSTKK